MNFHNYRFESCPDYKNNLKKVCKKFGHVIETSYICYVIKIKRYDTNNESFKTRGGKDTERERTSKLVLQFWGWMGGASVSVVQVSASEKNKRERISVGFSTYEWMIDEILKYGRILERQERKEMRDAGIYTRTNK